MKKSLLALAVLGAFAGVASAQSSVTLFGILDANAHLVKNEGEKRRVSMDDSGINSSRLGFRGIEDLGGGLKAGFWLEAGLNIGAGTATLSTTGAASNVTGSPSGTAQVPNQSKFFNRRSTVSLISSAGELRLGRDYVPSFWNETVFDAFGTNGLGGSNNVFRYFHVRQDNSIGYFLPPMGGLYGQLMVAAGESATPSSNASSLDKPGRYIGGRIGFAAGPFDIAFAGAEQRFTGSNVSALLAPGNLSGDRVKQYNVGGSYDFGFLKLLGYVERVKLERAKETKISISFNAPFGQSEVRVGFNRSKYDSDLACPTSFSATACDSVVQQIAATYVYNLSKRTAMYGTASVLDNKDPTSVSLPGGFGSTIAGGNSKGFEVGVRHIF